MRPTAFLTDFASLGGPELGPKKWPAAGLWIEGPAKTEALLELRPSRPQQHVLGFGAALTESSAQVIWSSPEADNILDDLFLPMERGGAGLSCLRVCIGSSDFSLEEGGFSRSRGLDLVVPVLRAAKQRNPNLTLVASPWTAPSWMKTSGAFCGGTLKDDCLQAYSAYLLRSLLFFEQQQLSIDAMTLQNEPSFETDYPSMVLTAPQQAALAKELVPILRRSGLKTLVLGHDDNYSEVGKAVELLRLAGDILDGTAWHAYKGDVKSLGAHEVQQNGVFFTEQTAHSVRPRSADFVKDMEWMMEQVLLGPLLHGARCGLAWNLALDPTFGPHLRGAPDNCRGVLEVPATGPHERSPEFFVLAHACHACSRGSWRLQTRSAHPGIGFAAFRDSSGSALGLLVQNKCRTEALVTVRCGDQTLTRLLLPSRSLASVAGLELAEAFRPTTSLTPPGPKVPVNCYRLAGAMFALKSRCHRTFLAAHGEMLIPYQSEAANPGDWERWTAVNVGERLIALRSNTGNFLAVALDGSLVLSRSWFDKLTFTVLAMLDGTVAFSTDVGFLQLPEKKGRPRFTLSRIGAHEVFEIVTACRLPRTAFAVRSVSTGWLLSAACERALVEGEAGETERWLAVKASTATYRLRNWCGSFLGCALDGSLRQVSSADEALLLQPYMFGTDVIGFDTADGNLQVLDDPGGSPQARRVPELRRERWRLERLELLPPGLPFTLQAEGGAYLSLVDRGVVQARHLTPGRSETWCLVLADPEDPESCSSRHLLRSASGVFLALGAGDTCRVEDTAEKAMPLEVTAHRDGTIDLVLSVQPRGLLVLPQDGSTPCLQPGPQKKSNRLHLQFLVDGG